MLSKQRLFRYLNSSDPLSADDVIALKILCDKRPLFAAAQMLLLKHLDHEEDHHVQAQRKHAALVCPNREALHNYITPVEEWQTARPSLDFQPKKEVRVEQETPTSTRTTTADEPKDIRSEKNNAPPKKKTEIPDKIKDTAEPTQKVEENSSTYNGEESVKSASKPTKVEKPKAPTKTITAKENQPPSPWEERIAALKARSEAIISQTKHVANDEDSKKEKPASPSIPPAMEKAQEKTHTKTVNKVQALPEKETDASVTDNASVKINSPEEVDSAQSTEIPAEKNNISSTGNDSQPAEKTNIEVQAEEYQETNATPLDSNNDSKQHNPAANTEQDLPSFSGWLQRLNREKDDAVTRNIGMRNEKWDRVDAFLQKLPDIAPPRRPRNDDQQGSPVAFSKEPADDNELITETLAKLYVDQGLINKAIKAYEILQLNIPEKSHLFKRQIQSLKERGKK